MIPYQHDYQQEDRTRGRIVGAAATLLYFVVVALLLLLIRFTLAQQPEGDGLMINFGNVDEAAPGVDLAANDEIADARQVQQPSPRVEAEEEILTQDHEEAPVVQQPRRREQRPRETPSQQTPQPKPAEQPPVEQPREVNRRALFPGRTAGSTSTSEGTGTGTGNQGNLAGTPDGSHDGTGTGTGGTGSFSLSGRSLLGALPRPDYNARDEGRVVVEIVVDRQGKVTEAAYRSVGSTTQNSTLVGAALRAARQARFNVDENATVSQRGTITYIFRMQ